MSKFTITFDPPLPRVVAINPPSTLENLDVSAIASGYKTEHNVLYNLDEKVFSYYPATILTILNDIHLEWMLIRGKFTHDVTLSGYTVLEAIFEQDGFQFRDPAWPPTPVGERFDAAYLEGKFRITIATVWGLIQSIQNSA